MAFYVDTSALVKLVVAESETSALRTWMAGVGSDLVAGDLVRTELMRAVRRVLPARVLLAQRVLDSLTLIDVTTSLFAEAGRLDPPELRSLDAIHLTVALDLGDDLDGLVTYDDRLSQAAIANGVPVVAPQ
ncbi:MAG: type II toxin-antitoxin system VapC family toxin [Acidimicrobiales bacterium]